MDLDISKLQSVMEQAKSLQTPRWASRKMLVTVGVVAVMIWFFKGALATILWQVFGLVALWLLCTTATDIHDKHCATKFKMKLIEELNKDGELTPAEVEILNKTT